MTEEQRKKLREIKTFKQLLAYLSDELEWPIDQVDDEDDLTFDWSDDLGLKDSEKIGIKAIKQLRPLETGQPWGIFFIDFEKKNLPIVILRRILNALVMKKRAGANRADRAAWKLHDLLFISSYGAENERQLTFAHFSEPAGEFDDKKPTLRVLGWDDDDTNLKLDHVADVLHAKLRWPQDKTGIANWQKTWADAFELRHREVIGTAEDLALRLAELAKRIRNRMLEVLPRESGKGALQRLFKGFKTALIHDLDEKQFADMYAQTITYGLFSAAVSRTVPGAGTAVQQGNVVDMVPITNPFLREMLQSFLKAGGRKHKLDFDELGIQEVVDLLNDPNTKMEAVLRDFGNRTRGEDPVIHFYEKFLAAYDKKLKVQRGVFYTPQPVVSYIVRSVHELLQTEFGLADGLADTATWADMLARHADMQLPMLTNDVGEEYPLDASEPFVQILDPATGTATFLVETIDVIHKTMRAKWQAQGKSAAQQTALWNEYVPEHLLPRLHGFELMMAPYAIAHMKIGLKLKETGYQFGSDERARIYLTNALEPWQKQLALPEFEALAHEAMAVNEVKRNKRFTVVIGNPPYSTISQNMHGWISELVNEYLQLPDGPMKEKSNRNHLQDDYVKFIRLAQTLIESACIGLVGMITNNSYFSGNWHRGMRYSLATSFQQMRFVNLHGGKGFLRSASDADENVFDIMQSVGLAFFSRGFGDSRSTIYQEIVGSRNQKYQCLAVGETGEKIVLMPSERNQWLFQPLAPELQPEWNACIRIDDVFVEWGAGVKTNRDGLATGFSRQEVESQILAFADLKRTDSSVEEEYSFKSNYQWKTDVVRKKFAKEGFQSDLVEHYSHRPFDVRFIYWHSAIVFNMRGDKMECFRSANPPVALLFARNTTKEIYSNFFVTHWITDIHCLETMNVAPLFTGSAGVSAANTLGLAMAVQPNFNRLFLTKLANRMSLPAIKAHSLPDGLTPEDIFHYIYAVFHSPVYRSRYAEFLKIDFPRLPLTGNLELFRALGRLGGELVDLHLLESPKLDQSITQFIGGRNPEVEKISWSDDTVWVDKAQTTGFRGVREDVWNFHIGGYQVCEKWLKDRKGRVLSKDDIAHYHKIVVALSETIRLMGEIDAVIEQHGGWPGAFQPIAPT